jgi:regulator of sigma E protease
MTALSYLFALVVMLGILVFVHELGHFLVAKACGVRVLKFSLGFGPTVGIGRWKLAWSRHGTEYVVAWFPLGGFVKMLGESPGEEEDSEARAHPEETLGAKPVWQKLAIVFAGPAMNLLLPVMIFSGMLFAGIPRALPVVGTVEVGSPAALAGFAAGDRITQVSGEPVTWWDEVDEQLRAQPGAAIPITIERAGDTKTLVLPVAARAGLDAFGNVKQVGWSGLGHARLPATIGVVSADAPAAAAGLRSGDRVAAVGGTAVEDWDGFERALAASADGTRTLTIERGAKEHAETLEVALPAGVTRPAELGLVPAAVLVSRVEPGSPAERADLRSGDLLVAVDGGPVGSFAAFAETVRASRGRALDVAYARDGDTTHVSISPEMREADTGMGVKEPRYLIGIQADAPALQGAVGEEVARNPLVAVPRAVAMTAEVTSVFLQGLGKLITGEVSRSQLAGPIGIAEIAHSALQRGLAAYLTTLILISINLGILNLLPIPVLDGGQAVLFLIEGVKRSPVSLRTREIVQQIGVTVLVTLMGFAFWNDLSRHWSSFVGWLKSSAGL